GEVAPYSFIDVCAKPRRVARQTLGTNLLSCFPFASRTDRFAAGDISALQGMGPIDKDDLTPMVSFKFEAHRSDDLGSGVKRRPHVRMFKPKSISNNNDLIYSKELVKFIDVGTVDNIKSVLGAKLSGINARTIFVSNGDSGTVAVKIPLSEVSEGSPILVQNPGLSGCTVVYAVRDDHFYIYHTGLRSNAEGLNPNWRTARQGVITLDNSHAALTGLPPERVYDNDGLVSIFSRYDSAFIVFFGKDGTRITRQAPNVKVFDYNEAESRGDFTARLGVANALLTRKDGRVKIEAHADDYFNPVRVGKSLSEVEKDFRLINSRRVELEARTLNEPIDGRRAGSA
ncbi:cytotoxic necrotizing factor Rho-activating domain-containing protein, partial [Burkholderia sp. DN3021]|uniref:cytotoxic necrotizing factor Rho-activating domain-containing protein n=1 Tax=Burkholderia sp. DN3021 TaxID=3410137 RepID=UPI003C797660